MTIERALALRDLADPSAGPHAVQLVVAALTDRLSRRGASPFGQTQVRGS